MQGKTKRLRVIAGPNASGKSSVVFHILESYYCGHFVNADELNKQLEIFHVVDLLKSFGINTNKDAFYNYLNDRGKKLGGKGKE